MAIIGVIEAELQGSTQRESGGIGPLFKKTTVTAPFALGEFLSRTLRALGKVEGITMTNLFIDEEELVAAAEGDELTVAEAQDLIDGEFLDDAQEFAVMCAYHAGDLTYTVSAEGDREHELGEPTIVVLASLVLPPWEEPPPYDDEEELSPVEDDVTLEDEDEEPDYIAQMEALLRRIQTELDKELALADPDLRVWDEALGDPTAPARGIEWAG